MSKALAKILQKRFCTFVCVFLSAFAVSAQAADSNLLRVAFGRFLSTKDPGSSLETLPAFFVDQRSVTQFQLVGADQTKRMVLEKFRRSENSASNSVDTSSAAMLQFGRSVGADLLITGLIIPYPHPRESMIWIKAVDVRTGIVRDAGLISECITNSQVTFNRVTEFVSKASHAPPRHELVALGPIIDLNPRTNRSAFPRHVQLLLEKVCYENGLGIVWQDAAAQGQDKAAQPKWFVDGTYELTANNLLAVNLSLHKSGFKPQNERFMAPSAPGPQLEEMLVAVFKQGLARTDWTPAAAADPDPGGRWVTPLAGQVIIARSKKHGEDSANKKRDEDSAKLTLEHLKQLESAVRSNPNDLKSKVALAQIIIFRSDADTERAIKMLDEAMASGDKEVVAAAKLAMENAKPPPPAVQPQPNPAPVAQPAAAEETVDSEEEKRNQFLQQNFAKFVPVKFQKGDGTNAVIQRLKTRENRFEYDGMYYSGFRFTLPDLNGVFAWIWILDNTEAQKGFWPEDSVWYIVPEKGRMKGFRNFNKWPVSDHKDLQRQFPYTPTFFHQTLHSSQFSSGKTYAIWFAYKEVDFPDIAFAMTIDTPRGREQFGSLPIH